MPKNLFGGKPVSFYLRMVSIVLAIIPIFYTAGLAGSIKEYPWSIGFLVTGIIAEVILLVFPDKGFSDYLMLAGAVFLSGAFCFFLMGGVLSIADYIAGVTFWGDPTQFPAIVAYSVVLFCSALLSVVNCYIK